LRLGAAKDDGRIGIDRSIAQGRGEIRPARRAYIHHQAAGDGTAGARDEIGFGHRNRSIQNRDQAQQARIG
jgi:hypothetical protein